MVASVCLVDSRERASTIFLSEGDFGQRGNRVVGITSYSAGRQAYRPMLGFAIEIRWSCVSSDSINRSFMLLQGVLSTSYRMPCFSQTALRSNASGPCTSGRPWI